jgi:hypothetical protein
VKDFYGPPGEEEPLSGREGCVCREAESEGSGGQSAPARWTETAEEAAMSKEEGEFLQTCTCTEGMVVYAAGHKREGGCVVEGDVCKSATAQVLPSPGGDGRGL